MAFPSITNVDGTNPGPNSAVPDTPQSSIGNMWKVGIFSLTLNPATIAQSTAVEQTFAATGIGLLTTDFVSVQAQATSVGVGIANARVSAADTLAINFINASNNTGTPTSTTNGYLVFVARVQPNWVTPASGNALDW